MLKEGDKVPTGLKSIVVTDEDVKNGSAGKKTSISSLYKDKVLILYFYPKDLTPGCTTEAINFRDHYKKFQKMGAEIVGCSRDDVKRHCKFMSKYGLAFPLLSDEDGAITEAFGVWGEKSMYGKKSMGIFRSTFIIKKGKIVKVYSKVKVKEHSAQILEDLKEIV